MQYSWECFIQGFILPQLHPMSTLWNQNVHYHWWIARMDYIVYSDLSLCMSDQLHMLNATLFWKWYNSENLHPKYAPLTATSLPYSSPTHLFTWHQFFNLTPTSTSLTQRHAPALSMPFLASSSPCPALNPQLISFQPCNFIALK